MIWSRKHTLIAGTVLIAVSNAVALIGVAYNRSGELESELQLTQRELASPYWGGFPGIDTEDGGFELKLQWRVASKGDKEFYPGVGGQPEWLDRAKLIALGYDLTPPENSAAGKRHYERLMSKQVFIVLELDGPAYQAALRRAQQRVDDEAAAKRLPNSDARSPAERLKREQASASRLFAVDAGVDPGELRNKYSDRKRYAVMRARVGVSFDGGSAARAARVSGFLSDVTNDRISVPPEFRLVFDSLPRRSTWGEETGARFDVTLGIGRRFEPWIIRAAGVAK